MWVSCCRFHWQDLQFIWQRCWKVCVIKWATTRHLQTQMDVEVTYAWTQGTDRQFLWQTSKSQAKYTANWNLQLSTTYSYTGWRKNNGLYIIYLCGFIPSEAHSKREGRGWMGPIPFHERSGHLYMSCGRLPHIQIMLWFYVRQRLSCLYASGYRFKSVQLYIRMHWWFIW